MALLCSVITAAERSIPRHRGTSDQALVASIYLRELGTGRWVDWAFDWTRGFTRLLVEVDKAIPPAHFVLFDHKSGGRANRQK